MGRFHRLGKRVEDGVEVSLGTLEVLRCRAVGVGVQGVELGTLRAEVVETDDGIVIEVGLLGLQRLALFSRRASYCGSEGHAPITPGWVGGLRRRHGRARRIATMTRGTKWPRRVPSP